MERTEDSYFIKLKFSLSASLSSCKAVILRLRTPNICPSEFLVGKECETLLIAKAPFEFPTQVGRGVQSCLWFESLLYSEKNVWRMYLHNFQILIFKDMHTRRKCHLSTHVFNSHKCYCFFGSLPKISQWSKLPLMFSHVKLLSAAILTLTFSFKSYNSWQVSRIILYSIALQLCLSQCLKILVGKYIHLLNWTIIGIWKNRGPHLSFCSIHLIFW